MPLADYLTAPRRTAGFRQGLGPVRTPQGELRQWAHQVVEKVRVASVGGRLRFLPWYDPYTDESPEMRREYRVMLREPTIKAAVQTKILSVISEELQFQPDNPKDEREKEVASFCKYAFGKLKGGIRELGWSVLHPALIDGVSICEKVRRVDPLRGGRFRGKRIYDKIKPKDSHFLQLGIDPFRNITAIKGTGLNAGKVWSPSDFIIFSYFPLYANPSGLSDFRAAYRAYWIKDTSWKLRSLHLENFTGPYLTGRYSTVEQKAALEDAFADARANTWMTIPAAAMVEALDLSMKGTSDFKDAIADCDREMLIAIVGAHLQNLEGQSGSGRHGDTKVHREIGELIQWWLAATLADVYQAQLVVPLVEENYHDVEPPDVTVGAVTDEDMLQKAQVYKALQETGMELSRKEAYQTFSMSQPETPEDVLRPPGQGGGAGGAPPPGGAQRVSAGPEGGDGGSSPFGEWARFQEGEYHGPEPPGPGWVQVSTGPHGGKVWRRERREGGTAPEPGAAGKSGKKPYGPSKAAVTHAGDPKKRAAAVKKVFGPKVKPEDVPFASLVGAPDDAKVTVEAGKDGKSLSVAVEGPGLKATRTFVRLGPGVVCVNEYIRLEDTGGGRGSDVFARQVEQCAANGVVQLQCHAARKNDRGADAFNGYYTWPRLGYDQDFEDLEMQGPTATRLVAEAQRLFPGADRVADLMTTKEGRDWWKANGTDLLVCRFDLREGSRSRQVLDTYLEERAASGTARKQAEGFADMGGEDREEITLSPTEEEALERAWERLGGGDSRHRSFCQEGENKGKPGPCPEGGETEVKSGAAVRKALAGGAGRVSLPGGAAVHVAAHPAGGHVAFIRRPDGSGTSGHPRPTRAAAVRDAQTLAVGHLKGKAPVGVDLPAAASLPPEAALRDTVSRLFPGATAAAPGEYEIDMAGGRTLSLALDPESRSVRVDFQNAPESGLGQQDVPAALRAGSLDLARKLKDVAGALAAHGTRISFGAVPRKQALYARVLSSLGFTREESRPAQDATEPGQVEEVWAPPPK
jgi:hypothetical protein